MANYTAKEHLRFLCINVLYAEFFKINRHELSRLFRDMTGLTFHQYLVRVRVLKAREILEAGNSSITQVCYESGFNDYAHFIRTFKAMVGKSPGSYAKDYIRK